MSFSQNSTYKLDVSFEDTKKTAQIGTGSVSIGKVKPLIKLLATEGVKPELLLANTDIQLSQLALFNVKISYAQYFKLIENACTYAPDPSFALRLGEQLYINHDGLLACRVMSCRNAAQAMRLLTEYQSLLTQLFSLDFEEKTEYAIFTATPLWSFDACLPYFIEYTYASIYSLGKFCTGSSTFPLSYEFTYDAGKNKAQYEAFFGKRVRFNCDLNRVIIPKNTLNMPFIFEDQTTARFNDKICQDKIRLVHQNTPIIEQVKLLIQKSQFTQISLQTIAEKLCMSPRTLRRHLSSENISYSDLLEEERKKRVQKALHQNIPMKHIAEQLGYSDASSFSRAFKQWFGIPPHSYKELNHKFE